MLNKVEFHTRTSNFRTLLRQSKQEMKSVFRWHVKIIISSYLKSTKDVLTVYVFWHFYGMDVLQNFIKTGIIVRLYA